MEGSKKHSINQSFPAALGHLVLGLLTSTYIGAYRYHTLEPIIEIHKHHNAGSEDDRVKALANFRRLKEEELAFVAKAAALSAAAVIGIFSWSATEKTIPAAKMLWDWSFFMATFSMIGSAPTRLLQHLPAAADQKDYDQYKVKRALNLFLQPKFAKGKQRKISRKMLWAWQCPAMLMSYSPQGQVSLKISVITICGCGLIILNFISCAAMCQYRLQEKPLHEWIPDLLSGSEDRHNALSGTKTELVDGSEQA